MKSSLDMTAVSSSVMALEVRVQSWELFRHIGVTRDGTRELGTDMANRQSMTREVLHAVFEARCAANSRFYCDHGMLESTHACAEHVATCEFRVNCERSFPRPALSL